ncbi:FAD:protein FMN transferase [Phenylobacterium sp.]|uniref:FAD:protein FMN transferase n=1 Tax=Phenylobacterium sp. TaxID=1871053 RepID=UPI002731C975|nr:FAD:protein FMN transferase [Phenylobacterium sp.]MDP2214266.1 FAD:protein FMN transferase [Phenylobacterium sp.]
MGVTWTLRAVTLPGLGPEVLARTVQGRLDAVVAEMSTWEPFSHISAFNRAPAGAWLDLPEGFARVMACALEVAALGQGAFDPTLGRLTDLWGFGPAGPVQAPPPSALIEEALASAGWRRLEFDARQGRLRQPGGLALDLSGIAKGFGIDLAARALLRLGVRHFLLEVGGELRGEGLKPDGLPWWVALERLEGEAAGHTPVVLALCGQSVATSGDYRRYMIHKGQRLAHTLDPRTGTPSERGVACVNVLHGEAMVADAWCTLLSVLGAEAGLELCAAHGVAARFLVHTKKGLEERLSPAFQALLDD